MLKRISSFLLSVFSILNLFSGFSIYASDQVDDSSGDVVYVVPGNSDLSETSRDTYAMEAAEDDQSKVPFIVDKELNDFIKEKDRLADEYYEARCAGNSEVAAQKLNEFKQLTGAQGAIASGYSNLDQSMDEGIDLHSDGVIWAGTKHFPQKTSYYCGPATAQMILYRRGIECTQEELAGMRHLQTDYRGETPWYITNGYRKTDFPMAYTLTALTGISYTPMPYGYDEDIPLDPNEIRAKIITALEAERCVALSGVSKINVDDPSHLPGYPTQGKNIGHWLVCYAWDENTDEALVMDPAKSKAVTWSNNIRRSYRLPLEKLEAFVSAHGIIY